MTFDRKAYNKKFYRDNKTSQIKRVRDYYYSEQGKKRRQTDSFKEMRKKWGKKWRESNKEKIREYAKKYKERRNQMLLKRRQSDIQYKLACSLRSRLRAVLVGEYKVGSAVRDLGCSLDEFKTYIESKFENGMSWENNTRNGWHIDHIIPLVMFDLTDRKQFLQACHYTNLQPLWAKENYAKKKKRDTFLKFSQLSENN